MAEHNHRLNAIAREIYIRRHGEPACRECRKAPADVHHKDGNRRNNRDDNHLPLCRSCHTALENKLHPRRKKIPKPYAVKFMDPLWYIVINGEEIWHRQDGKCFRNKQSTIEYAKELTAPTRAAL